MSAPSAASSAVPPSVQKTSAVQKDWDDREFVEVEYEIRRYNIFTYVALTRTNELNILLGITFSLLDCAA